MKNLILLFYLFTTLSTFSQTTQIDLPYIPVGDVYVKPQDDGYKINYWTVMNVNIFPDMAPTKKDVKMEALIDLGVSEEGYVTSKEIIFPKIPNEKSYTILSDKYIYLDKEAPVLGKNTDQSKENIERKYQVGLYRPFAQTGKIYDPQTFSCSQNSIFKNGSKYNVEFTNRHAFNEFHSTEPSILKKIEVDYSTNEPNTNWEYNINQYLSNKKNVGFAVFQKKTDKDKTKKWSYLKEYKFSSFNADGPLHSEEITFEEALFEPQKGIWINENGGEGGFYYIMREASGMGYGGANKEADKKHIVVMLFDNDGKFLKKTNVILPFEIKFSTYYTYLGVFQHGDSHDLVVFKDKSKPDPDRLLTFDLNGATQSEFKTTDYNSIIANSLDGKAFDLLKGINDGIKTGDGSLIIYSIKEGVIPKKLAPGTISEPDQFRAEGISFIKFNKDHEIVKLGTFGIKQTYTKDKIDIHVFAFDDNHVGIEVSFLENPAFTSNQIFTQDINSTAVEVYQPNKEGLYTQYVSSDNSLLISVNRIGDSLTLTKTALK